MKIQTLVVTMNQSDHSLPEKMNIQTDAVVGNQCGRNEFDSFEYNNNKILYISTATRGVGLNRNIALLASDADIVLFADDDMTYYEGLSDGILRAFFAFPDADVMIFSVDLTKEGRVFEERRVPQKRMHLWNSLKYGTYAIAAKKCSIEKNCITFNHFFGGGCVYGSGEDSLFLKECFDKKLKVYSYNYVLGRCNKDHSSWFKGYNDKFFFDKGALFANIFPKLKIPVITYFAMKFRKSDIGFIKRFSLMIKGASASKNLIAYD